MHVSRLEDTNLLDSRLRALLLTKVSRHAFPPIKHPAVLLFAQQSGRPLPHL